MRRIRKQLKFKQVVGQANCLNRGFSTLGMKFLFFGALALFLLVSGVVPRSVLAGLKYGTGYYSNLCGTGTAATAYTCNNGCSPATGTCTTTGDGAVRYVCQGNWNQCLENEIGWVNGVSVGDPGCDNTVQLSIYDHKCRRDDGTWDVPCQLLGYMVWYSGDCRPGVAGYTTGIPLLPTSTPKPTPKISPTVSKTQGACNKTCVTDTDCTSGLFCDNKVCRNRDCPLDKTCFCSTSSITPTGVPAVGGATSPETGISLWLIGLGILGLGYLGIKVLHIGKILWQ